MVTKELILDTAMDLISDFLYYDRNNDEELPSGAIQTAIKDGVINVEEIIEVFEKELRENLKE